MILDQLQSVEEPLEVLEGDDEILQQCVIHAICLNDVSRHSKCSSCKNMMLHQHVLAPAQFSMTV